MSTDMKDPFVPSKISQMAKELRIEKQRLEQDLADLQHDYDEVKPTTPTGTPDWYVKWVSMILAVGGVFLMSADIIFYGQVAYVVSSCGWVYVGMQWSDRAIMIGSAISGTAVMMNMVQAIQ